MFNKGGRVSPDYLADIAPEYASLCYEKNDIDTNMLDVDILRNISIR